MIANRKISFAVALVVLIVISSTVIDSLKNLPIARAESSASTFAGSLVPGRIFNNLYVISVGVNGCKSCQKVLWAEKDAHDLVSSLEKRAKVLYRGVKKYLLTGDGFRRGSLEMTLDVVAREIRADDTFIFFFAGTSALNKQQELYLLTNDSDDSDFEKNAFSSDMLRLYLRKIQAQSQVVIMDTNDSAALFDNPASMIAERVSKALTLRRNGLLFLGVDQNTYEIIGLGNGMLTSSILDGLAGKADKDANGIISARELEASVYVNGLTLSQKYKVESNPRSIMRGGDFEIGFSDKQLNKLSSLSKKENADIPRSTLNGEARRSEITYERKGKDYALFFACDEYVNSSTWPNLNNPVRDVKAVAGELVERYGFDAKNIEIVANPTQDEFSIVLEKYLKRADWQADDQLLVFFAGHGGYLELGRKGEGYLIFKDSPAKLARETERQFINLDHLVTKEVNSIACPHIFMVFDACFAGKVWEPTVQVIQDVSLSPVLRRAEFSARSVSRGSLNKDWQFIAPFSFANPNGFISHDLSNGLSVQESLFNRDKYIKEKLGKYTRIIFTSGAKTVPDGYEGGHSPFAIEFLEALQTNGNIREQDQDAVLTSGEIFTNFLDKLEAKPQRGKLSGSDGDFVFAVPKKRAGEGTR